MNDRNPLFIKIVIAPCQIFLVTTGTYLTTSLNLSSLYRFLEANMKVLLFFLAAVIACVHVEGFDCPHILWGCRRSTAKKSYRSRHQYSQLKLRLQRDAPGSRPQLQETELEHNVPCSADDYECLAKIQELREKERQQLNAPKSAKRQLNCPFGVWGCKKRRVLPKRSTKSDNSDVNDLINELFTGY